MNRFNEQERAYLTGLRLGRLATVDDRGRPHVVPTGFHFDPAEGVIEIGGYNLASTKKFRDARANPRVAFVVDDIVSTNPWRVRGVEVRGRAQAFTDGGERLDPGFGTAWLRIIPTRVVSWGLDADAEGPADSGSMSSAAVYTNEGRRRQSWRR